VAEELIELGRASRCGKGKVRRSGYHRSGYTRKDGTRVAPTRVGPSCVPDTGAPGKTPSSKKFLPELGPKPLNGWHKEQSESERASKLRGLARKRGCREALRTVNAIANVTTDRETERKLRSDYKKLRAHPSCHLKTKK
jgi:hypothetical protein